MEVKVTIETWNDEWRFEIEDKEDGETLNAGYFPTFGQCVSECNRHLSQLHAAEQSAQRTATNGGGSATSNPGRQQIEGSGGQLSHR